MPAKPMGEQHGTSDSLPQNAWIPGIAAIKTSIGSTMHDVKAGQPRVAAAQLSEEGSKRHPVDPKPALVAYVNSVFSLHRHLFEIGEAAVALDCSPLQHCCRRQV